MSLGVQSTGIEGLLIIEPETTGDIRGSERTAYQAAQYASFGMTTRYVSDQYVRSFQGTLRGLSYQKSGRMAQLVSVIRGDVHLVVVDVRQQSKTFGQWVSVEITDAQNYQVYMAPGLAYGYCVLSDTADMHIKQSSFADPLEEGTILWNDADLKIDWPLKHPLISENDTQAPNLRDINENALPYYDTAKVFA